MKALVLSGGAGTRLRPITHTSAKQLVPVANRPMIEFGLQAIAEAGISDVGIIVGDTHAEIEAHVGDGSRFGLNVTYIRQAAPLGLAHAVLAAADFLGEDPFVMYPGDNLIAGGITAFVEQFTKREPAAQVLVRVVVEEGAELRSEDSLIGKEVEVAPATAKPRAYRPVLGDHSRVGML